MDNKTAFQRLFYPDDYQFKNNYTREVLSKINHCQTKDLGYHFYQCNNSDCSKRNTIVVAIDIVRFVVRSKKNNG